MYNLLGPDAYKAATEQTTEKLAPLRESLVEYSRGLKIGEYESAKLLGEKAYKAAKNQTNEKLMPLRKALERIAQEKSNQL